ncbi:MAG TPA: alpha/beta hydrolase, partial [Vitreimonas sp.]|nr:alpha/beta hydrolase [Vitreimonas sp.]
MDVDVFRRNNVRVFGRGEQPMLLAHGFGCDQNMWRFVTPAFEDDYQIVLFDYVGHGKSDRDAYDPSRYRTLDGFARDILDIVTTLDLRDVVLVGHSVSSIISVLAANAEPDRFARLVLIGPSPRYINDPDTGYIGGFNREDIEGLLDALDSNYFGWSSTMAPVIMGNPDRPALGAELANSFCQTDPAIARQFARVTFLSDNRADLARVGAKCLVLQCASDVIAPESVGRYVHAQLPGSELV